MKCGFCCFCEERPEESHVSGKVNDDRKEKGSDNNHTHTPSHTNTQHTQHTQQLSSSCAIGSHDLPDCHHASSQHQSGLDCEVGRGRRTSTNILDCDADESQVGRAQGGEEGCRQYGNGVQAVSTETSLQEETGLGKLPEQGRDPFLNQCNHSSNVQLGREGHLRRLRAGGHREGELRQVCRSELPAGGIPTSQLLGLGDSDSSRVRQSPLEAVQACSLGCSSEASRKCRATPCHQGLPETCESSQERVRWQLHGGVGAGPSQPRGQDRGTSDQVHGQEGVGDADEGSRVGAASSSVEGSRGCQECFGVAAGQEQDSEGDLDEHAMPQETALNIARGWHAQRNPLSTHWQNLVHHGRPLLMELACYPNSLLSEEVERRFGKGAAIRVSEWNGGNLEVPSGVHFAKQMLRKHRPVHLWISCECSPYCPLQRLNQRNEFQRQCLEEKRSKARNQYSGASDVAIEAAKLGIQVHWELSERCEAWQLEVITQLIAKLEMKKCTCHGCAVGLRTKDGRKILCKGWSIATTNERMAQHMNLRCQKNHSKGKCEAGQTAHTARYTQAFVRRVVDVFVESELWSRVLHDLQKVACPAEEVEDVDIPEADLEEQISSEERKEIEAKIQHIHRSTGHGNMNNLIKSLEQRGVPQKVLQVARQWKCPVCTERKSSDPRRYAHLHTTAQKWERVQMDLADWMHPITKEKSSFVLMVDEGCRFKVGKVLHAASRNANWEDLKTAFEELWLPVFGMPHTVRVDPAGAWLKNEADDYFSQRSVFLDPIPGEAHWQIGVVETGIKSIKGIMTTLATEFPEFSPKELFGRSIWVCNNNEQYRGYTPFQHAMGRAPDQEGRIFDTDDTVPLLPSMLADAGFQEDSRIRCAAEKAFAEEQAKRKIERALHMGHRRSQVYAPGDLVYYWRRQLPAQDRRAFQAGKFLGPARVIAMETRREEGEFRPGSVIWLHRAGRLIKAAPEQLRRASLYEQQLEEMKGPIDLPWTITTLVTDPKRRTYVDISGDIPEEEEWEQALDQPTEPPGAELGVPSRRLSRKSTVPPPAEGQRTSKERKKEPAHGEKREGSTVPLEGEGGSSSSGRRRLNPEEEEIFYSVESTRRAIEIEIEIPSSKRQLKKFLQQPEAFVAQKLKKRQVEVHEKHLTQEEALQFCKAKDTEVRNFIASECFQLASGQSFTPEEVMGMRWLLTWKYDDEKYAEQGGKKAKARAIVLGYQDPNYEFRKTSAPTPTKAGRQLFFQTCAWKKFRLTKGDVSGAFLQGADLEEDLWCRPLPEICKAIGVEADTPMLLKKAAYGLVQAPLHWYQSICTYLTSIGYRRLITEPCCWIYVDEQGHLKSIIHGHVDDFMFAGEAQCPVHQHLMEQIRGKYQWGAWEHGAFVQCGISVTQQEDFSIRLKQEKFIDDLEEIAISRDRQRQPDQLATEKERSQLRGVLGSLSWLCGQTCFLFSVDVNFLISSIPVATVNEINKTNSLVRQVRRWKHQDFWIHSFPKDSELVMACWTDAAHANRPNNKDSTEGIFVGMAQLSLEQGEETEVTPLYWRSGKIDRTCRSPACAETMAGLDGEDDLLYLRVLWNEMQGGTLNPRYPNELASHTRGLLITDARNLFDKLQRATVSVKGAEKRSDIEAICLRENTERSNVRICWVHGGAMIANGLTKVSEKHQMMLYLSMGFRWRIIFDAERQSEKQRRKLGIAPMEGLREADITNTQTRAHHTTNSTQQHQHPHHQQSNNEQSKEQ